ncbi:MAG: ATP-binding protein [Acidobacteriota bacterium]|nr:ATP-binding protein [Acidobacteriota bacterium]
MSRVPAKVSRQVNTLLDGSFLDRKENLLIFGIRGRARVICCAAGTDRKAGPAHVLTTCPPLVQDLQAAKRDLKLSRTTGRLARYVGLIIDEMGYVQQSREEMERKGRASMCRP